MLNIIKIRFNQDAHCPEFQTIGEMFGTSSGYTLCSGPAVDMNAADWNYYEAKEALSRTFPDLPVAYGYTDGFLPDATFVFQF